MVNHRKNMTIEIWDINRKDINMMKKLYIYNIEMINIMRNTTNTMRTSKEV